jgi:hypothetical protein
MPTQETQYFDNVIASRRSLLMGGGAALAALAMPKPASAAATVSTYTDNDILNFALNLEYLESNFYYLAAFGTTIDVANSSSMAAGAGVQSITGVVGGNSAGSTAGETAIEEGKHVAALRGALGSLAVAQPAMNLTPALFNTLAGLALIPAALLPFSPYANEAYFLLGAYIFEDVGVSAYHGAAPLITGKTTVLPTAAGILAVEAYHAGLVRTSLNAADVAGTYAAVGTLATVTGLLSAFRTKAAQALPQSPVNPEDPTVDDYGLALQTVTLNGSAVMATQIVDTIPLSAGSTYPATATAFARSTSQVLNIVTAGGAVTAGAKATGGFFPNGLNGLFI